MFILTTVSQSHCPEDDENDSIHQWRRKKYLLICLIYISQTNKNNSCVFQTYSFYIHTLFLLYASTITSWVIYKGSYCPISQKDWINDACSELTCWLESTRTWFQLNSATHCGIQVPCSAPPWQVGSIPQSPPQLAAGTSCWYRLKPRGQQGRAAAENTLGFSKGIFSACSGTEGMDAVQCCSKGQTGTGGSGQSSRITSSKHTS